MKSALVVDDDRQVSDLLARWLESAGYQVSTCLDFEGARRRILNENGPPVLVVDVRLEGYNGIHLAILARQLRPDSRVVVLTGWDDPVLRQEARACGAAYLCKPLDAEKLLAAIEATITGAPSPADYQG
jgi:DNA-binding response OmpR family regulator